MSYEKSIQDKNEKPEKVDISLLKFFWQASKRTTNSEETIPRFLKQLEILKNFTDNELRILCHYLHRRIFSEKELLFSRGDVGIGFYFIYSGSVEVFFGDPRHLEAHSPNEYQITLERYDCFGELALLQRGSLRTGTAIAKEPTELLGIFKPDLDEMINQHPVVAARLLQSIGVIMTNRLSSATREIKVLNERLKKLEGA